jgi:hypothetical protein
MRLLPDWRDVLRRAWSLRLIALAGLLSALEVALTMFPDVLGLPRGTLAVATTLVTAAAFVARLIAQKRDDE